MGKVLSFILVLLIITTPFYISLANDSLVDGTNEGPSISTNDNVSTGPVYTPMSRNTYILNPIDSVSTNYASNWADNRHRAYFNTSTSNIDGYLLFDFSSIPDNAKIVSMTLRCYLENAYGSPKSGPVVDIHHCNYDGWTRSTALPTSFSLGAKLVDDISFISYTPTFDFTLDVSAHNWSIDLADNELCLGFRNDVNYYSYVYFFGAYGSPTGQAPELTVVVTEGLSSDVSSISATTGGTVNFTLDAGATHANRSYVMLGSASGTSPGITLSNGLVFPLNWDLMTNLVIDFLNTPTFQNFMGSLDSNGKAKAVFYATSLPGAAGLNLDFAYTLIKPIDFISNPITITVTP